MGEGIKSIGSQIALVAEGTHIDDVETFLGIPSGIVFRCQFDARKHAERIGGGRIDGLGLVNPVELEGEEVGGLVKVDGGEGEIFVEHMKLADIHHQIIVKVNFCGNFRQHADTFCQLEQEVPSGGIFHICAGQHIDQVRELGRNRDFRHINGKDVRCGHLFIQINGSIGNTVHSFCIGNVTEPSQMAVAACGQVKVKGVFPLSIHIEGDCAKDGGVICQAYGDSHHLNAGGFVAYKYIAVDSTYAVIFKEQLHIVLVDGNGLVVVACGNGEDSIGAVNGIHMGFGEVDGFGDDHIHFGHTDHLFAQHHKDFHGALSQTREYAVGGDGGKAVIRHCPSVAFGKFRFVACGADALPCHLHRSANGGVLIVAFNERMVKFSRAGCGGDNDKRVSNRTLHTVGGVVDNSKAFFTGLFCHIGGRSAAVQVYSRNTSCIKHNLGDFLHTTAAGEGFLTAVQYHQHHLACFGNTHCGSGGTVNIVQILADSTVSNQHSTKATNGFCQLTSINFVIFIGSADNGLTVLGDAKEATLVDTVVFLAVHNEEATGFTGRHIKAVSIHTSDNIIVRNVIGAFRVAVFVLRRVGLVKDTGHFPTEARIGMGIVGVYIDIASIDIGGGYVIDHLLTVSGDGIIDFLGDTGGKLRRGRGEYCKIGIFNTVHIVTGQLAEVICKSIAGSTSEGNKRGTVEVSCAFQGGNQLIAKVSVIDRISHLRSGTVGAETVGHKVGSTVFVGEVFCHVVKENFCKRISIGVFVNAVFHRGEYIHHIVSIKVTVIVLFIKAGQTLGFGGFEEIVLADDGNHIFQFTANAIVSGNLQQVNQVSCPTGNVCVVQTALVVVGDVHCTEHVADIGFLTVGKSEA